MRLHHHLFWLLIAFFYLLILAPVVAIMVRTEGWRNFLFPRVVN